MKIELEPTEVVQIDIYQFDDNANRTSAGSPTNDTDYALDLEVRYTLQSNEEYTLTKRFYATSYRDLLGGEFLERLLCKGVQTSGVDEIKNIPIRFHLQDRDKEGEKWALKEITRHVEQIKRLLE